MNTVHNLQITENAQKDWETSQKASFNPSQKVTKI